MTLAPPIPNGHVDRRGAVDVDVDIEIITTGVAIIGCGYWGGNYVRIFNDLADATVRVVCDADPARLEEVRRNFPGVATTASVDDALAMPGVDAVVVVTTATSHYDVTMRALRAGKHVLVEKPLTTDSMTAQRLVDASEDADLLLLVGHTFLYNPGIRLVKDYVDRSSVYYLYAQRTSLGPIRHDVNAVWDLAPHDVSIFNHLLGTEPEWASATGGCILGSEREDVAFITLGYPGGVLGNIHVSWADPNKVRQVVVVTGERRIVFDDLDPLERVRIFDKGIGLAPTQPDDTGGFGEHQLLLRDGDIISPLVRPSEPLKNQCGHFLHCIRRGDIPMTSGSHGLAVVRTMEAITASLTNGGRPVEVASP